MLPAVGVQFIELVTEHKFGIRQSGDIVDVEQRKDHNHGTHRASVNNDRPDHDNTLGSDEIYED